MGHSDFLSYLLFESNTLPMEGWNGGWSSSVDGEGHHLLQCDYIVQEVCWIQDYIELCNEDSKHNEAKEGGWICCEFLTVLGKLNSRFEHVKEVGDSCAWGKGLFLKGPFPFKVGFLCQLELLSLSLKYLLLLLVIADARIDVTIVWCLPN